MGGSRLGGPRQKPATVAAAVRLPLQLLHRPYPLGGAAGVAVQCPSRRSRPSNGSEHHLRAAGKPRRRRGLSACASIGSAIAEIACSGYPKAMSTDSTRASEALGLFVGDTVARLDRTGDGATQRR
jgi:hypothetical protein